MKREKLNRDNSANIPQTPGVYYLYNAKKALIYIGAASKLRHRVSAYHQDNNHLEPWEARLKRNAKSVTFRKAKNKKEALTMETKAIQKHDPFYNHYKNGKKGKR